MKPNKEFVEGRQDETLLMEGRYRDWFWQGLSPTSVKFLRAEEGGRTDKTYLVCKDCKLRKPRASFNIGTVCLPGKPQDNRCNKCTLNTSKHSKITRWENDLPVAWETKASCEGMDRELFFPKSQTQYVAEDAAWRDVCPECPVKELCEQFARKSKSTGIFGGKLFMWKSNTLTVLDETTAKPAGRPRKAS